jgi:hypothetical protein
MSITKDQIENYLNVIKADYANWHRNVMGYNNQAAIDHFNASVRVDEGKSYLKVIKNGSVHSFIVKADSGKFKAGDVLKAASFKAPAKNFARGNIITGELSQISWSM